MTHVVVGLDPGDPCAAAWYVVATAARRICRAHGADEVEWV